MDFFCFLFRQEENEVKKKIDSQQQQLRQLKESKTNRMKRFGTYMPDLCEAIDAANAQGQFTYKPIGPLGNPLVFFFM